MMTTGSPVAIAVIAIALALLPVPGAADREPALVAELPDLAIEGEIRHSDGRWEAEGFYARVGEVPMTGNLVVALSGETRSVEGFLRLPSLDHEAARSLLEELGLPQVETEDDRLIPSAALHTDWLENLALDLDLELAGIEDFEHLFERAIAHVGVQNRVLTINGLDVTLSSGTISGDAILDARQQIPSADLALVLREIDLEPFIQGSPLAENLAGILHAHLNLTGVGTALSQLLANAEGEVSIAVERGWIDALAVHAAGLDVIRGLGLFIGDDEQLALNCGRFDFVVADGIAEVTRLVVDTTDAVVIGGGTIDLGTEQLEVIFDARQKDFTLIEAPRTVSIAGTFTEVEIEMGEIDGIDFLQPGEAEPLDCARLVGDDFWDMPG